MVDYHYIKRGNKIYGPYYYRSYRVGDKVKKEYLGKTPPSEFKRLPSALTTEPRILNIVPIFFLILILIFGVVLLRSLNLQPTGKVAMQLSSNTFNANQTISGNFNLMLKEGEFLPADSIVKIEIANITREMPFSEVISLSNIQIEQQIDSFFIENSPLTGQGAGFGFKGKTITYPEVFFQLKIQQENQQEFFLPENQSEIQNETLTDITKQANESAANETNSTQQENISASGITGFITEETEKEILESVNLTESEKEKKEFIINASARYNQPFTYPLEKETAELIPNSVHTQEKNLNDDSISLTLTETQATVTTSYSEETEGFGDEFLGNLHTLELNLTSLGISIEQAGKYSLTISLQYQNETITNASSEIEITKPEVKPINHAPSLLREIPDISIEQNSSATLNLSEYFADEDNDALTFSSTKPENISVGIENGMALLIPNLDFVGSREIIFYASDSINTTQSNLVGILVTENITNITLPVPENITILNETLVQHRAVIGQPVKWTKKIKLEKPGNITVKLPIEAGNITVKIVTEEETQKEATSSLIGITGAFIAVPSQHKSYEQSTFRQRLMRLTGFAVEQPETLESEIEKLKEAGYEEFELAIEENATEYEIEYETPAPYATEQEISEARKQITISSDVHYEDILAFTSLPEIVPIEKQYAISLYWLVNESKQEVNFTASDTNANNLIDKIEWNVPHLSNETYEVAITIINVQSYPTVSGNWTVYFNTTGEADLRITAIDGTTWNYNNNSCGAETCELRFENLTCGSTLLNSTWQENSADGSNNSVFYANYSCSQKGAELSIVLRAALHTLKFQFGSDMAYAHNQVDITGCYNITTLGSYRLTQPITNWNGPSGQACINISVSDVELDCQGWNNWIDGQGTANTIGIKSEGKSSARLTNVSVKNCNLTDWENGVYYAYTENSNITNSTIKDNKQYGIYLYYSSFNNITGSRIENNSVSTFAGIYIYSSTSDATLNSSKNRFWNNIINNTPNGGLNVKTYGINYTNYLNTTKTLGTNIIDGDWIAGNYWSDYTGIDSNGDGIGDSW